jgi:hypothetical protein
MVGFADNDPFEPTLNEPMFVGVEKIVPITLLPDCRPSSANAIDEPAVRVPGEPFVEPVVSEKFTEPTEPRSVLPLVQETLELTGCPFT